MNIEGWVIVTMLFAFLVWMSIYHRRERRVEGEANRKVVKVLTDVIKDAANTTNIFNAGNQQNQIGENNEQQSSNEL